MGNTAEEYKKVTARKYYDFMREFKKQCTEDNTFSPHALLKEMQINRKIIRVLKDLKFIQHRNVGRMHFWQWYGPRITLKMAEEVRARVSSIAKNKSSDDPPVKKSRLKTNPVKKIKVGPKNRELISERDPRIIRLEDIYHELESIKSFLRMIYLKNK